MLFHLTSAVILAFIASKCGECALQREICPCVPLNICPEISHFKDDDEKYFSTVLKCSTTGYVRCCSNNESVKPALRRSDDSSNTILISDNDDLITHEFSMKEDIITTEIPIETTTTINSDVDETYATETTTEEITTEQPSLNNEKLPKIDDGTVELIYPNREVENKNKSMENIFLIFPNGEEAANLKTDESPLINIEDAAKNESTTEIAAKNETTPIPIEERPRQKSKRIVIKKRLKKKLDDSIEGAESKLTRTIAKPTDIKQTVVDTVISRSSSSIRKNDRTTEASTKPTLTTTISTSNEESTTLKKKIRRKILKTRPTTIEPTLATTSKFIEITSTSKPMRKVLYDTRSRTNFLKRPSHQNQQEIRDSEEDEMMIDPAVTLPSVAITTSTAASTTEEVSRKTTVSFVTESIKKQQKSLPKVMQQANRIDMEHKTMIQTLQKALSAIHRGVDMVNVEKMIEKHKARLEEIRKNPPTVTPTRPYRGSAKYKRPTMIRDYTSNDSSRTKKLSKSRTILTTTTTRSPERITIRKSPRLAITQPPTPPTPSSTTVESFSDMGELEFELPPKNAKPTDFRASQLYGITMEKSNELDSVDIEKIYKTHEAPKRIQNGFFPVIENGTPSTLL